jgi:hypothetical protein
MTYSRRRQERGTIVVLFVVVLAGLVMAISAENVAGTIIRGHGRAHWHAENTARVAAQAIDEALYHTTGARVVDLTAARIAARQYAAQLTDPVDVADVVRQKDTVTVTVVLRQQIDAGPASFTLPIVETASAQLQQP